MRPFTKAIMLATSFIAANSYSAESLETLYDMARLNDPSIKAAVNGIEQAQQMERQALGALLPSANGSISYGTGKGQGTNARTLETFQYTFGDTANLSGSLSVNQALFNMQAFKGYAITDLQIAQADLQVSSAEQALMLQVAQAAIAVMKAETGVELARRQEQAVARQLEQVEAKYQEGLVARTEVENARASYEEARLGVLLQTNALSAANRQLTFVVGEPVETAPINPGQAEALAIGSLENWLATAEDSPSMRAQALNVALAESQVTISEYGYWPTANASLSYSRGASFQDWVSEGDLDEQGQWQLGLSVNIPIFNGFRTSADIVNKQIQAENAAASFDQGMRQTYNSVTALYEQVQSDIANISVREQLLRSRESASDATEAGYEVGTTTIVDVIGAQSSLFASERDLNNARYDLLLNTLKLKQAAGELSLADLAALN